MRSILLSALLLVFIAGLFSSCKRTYCFDCTTERYYVTVPDYDTVRLDSSMKTQCNETESSIISVEEDGTHYVQYWKDGELVTEYTVTKCDK